MNQRYYERKLTEMINVLDKHHGKFVEKSIIITVLKSIKRYKDYFETNHASFYEIEDAKILNVEHIHINDKIILKLKLKNDKIKYMTIYYCDDIESNCLNVNGMRIKSIFENNTNIKIFVTNDDEHYYKIKFKSNKYIECLIGDRK